jgi:hypothetical protein
MRASRRTTRSGCASRPVPLLGLIRLVAPLVRSIEDVEHVINELGVQT